MSTSQARMMLRAVSVVGLCTFVVVANSAGQGSAQAPAANEVAEALDLFEARDAGNLEIKVVVSDAERATIVLHNLLNEALSVKLPDVVAARPILAQFGGPFGGRNNLGGGQPPQAVGGPTANGANAGPNVNAPNFNFFQGGNVGNNLFNIAPEAVRTISIRCFCLEQGKPDPRSAVTYELVPLAEVNDDPRLPWLLSAATDRNLDRDVVQAAVWHAANGKSWDELAGMSQMIAGNVERPVFDVHRLRKAKALVEAAGKLGTRSSELGTPDNAAARKSSVDVGRLSNGTGGSLRETLGGARK